jgi:transposase InsO family protein
MEKFAEQAQNEIKAVSPISLPQKAHTGSGLPYEELIHRLNDECIRNGLPALSDLPERPPVTLLATAQTTGEKKYRLTCDFGEINRKSKVPAFMSGDIRDKQQRLAGHRYMCKFDFAAGFYALAVEESSQPYLAFFVPDMGFRTWTRMPFGATGAPTAFGCAAAEALEGLVGDIMELFVDDGGAADNEFEGMLRKMRTILERARSRGLSISPQKTELFVSEMVFGGGKVSREGLAPDPAKVTAVVEWERPRTLHNLMGFLGLTGYFRPIIRNYSRIARPLTDLCRYLEIPRGEERRLGPRKLKSILKAKTLDGIWTNEHMKAFIELKRVLTSTPVLRSPQMDGTPFIVTTDGSMHGFGGVLAQRFTYRMEDGKQVTRTHPIAYVSKRTSESEEKYIPYLLEFAALKFALDKFADVTWGAPIEIETDCQALRDTLVNDKMTTTHARWRDGILAHQIVNVRHRPGVENGAADGFSRQYTDKPKVTGDGSEWTVSQDWEAAMGIVNDIMKVDSDDFKKLQRRFKEEALMLDVIEALAEVDGEKDERRKKRAQKRAAGYMVEDGRLWKVASGVPTRGRARVECVTREEATELARKEHNEGGHWGRDVIKIQLLDRICSPRLDQSIITAITECGACKNYGATYLHSLLDPIVRRHPFELIVGDYLSLPNGKGGYHTVGLFLDTCTQFVWGFKFKTHGTGKTTVDSLSRIRTAFTAFEVFQSDGGRHFDCQEVRDWCEAHESRHHVVAAYSPWVNGLVENANKQFLGRLKRLCAPDLDEDSGREVTPENIPKKWPDYFEVAISQLNDRILPAFKHSPRELLFGRVINTKPTPVNASAEEPTTLKDIETQMAYVEQQRLDGLSHTLENAIRRKEAFDRRVHLSRPGAVTFNIGDYVQVYNNALAYSFKTERKILPQWSIPRRVVERLNNSYRLETLDGQHIPGLFHARRLREFIPAEGSDLAKRRAAEKAEEAAPVKRVVTEVADGASAQAGGEDGVEDPGKARGEQEREWRGVSGVPEDQGSGEETRARTVCMCYTTT